MWAFISWVVYAGYLHARATPSVKRTVATWIALLGFATMLMNLFGVNLFFEGLHSYANAGGCSRRPPVSRGAGEQSACGPQSPAVHVS